MGILIIARALLSQVYFLEPFPEGENTSMSVNGHKRWHNIPKAKQKEDKPGSLNE